MHPNLIRLNMKSEFVRFYTNEKQNCLSVLEMLIVLKNTAKLVKSRARTGRAETLIRCALSYGTGALKIRLAQS